VRHHEIHDLADELLAEEPRHEHVRVREVHLLSPGGAGAPDREMAAPVVIEDRGEHGRRVEPGQAEPVDVAVHGDQRGRVQIADDPVVLDRSSHLRLASSRGPVVRSGRVSRGGTGPHGPVSLVAREDARELAQRPETRLRGIPFAHAGWAMTGPSAEGDRWRSVDAQGPALVFRDDTGEQQYVALDGRSALTLGRGSGCDVRLPWDERVSRVHAGVERVGSDWTLVDDGLSRNGTFLNGERLSGRRRLRDGDTFVLGSTSFRFRDATRPTTQLTKVGEQILTAASLSPTQRQIVTALCRPYKHDDPYATPASNQHIAEELFLSVDAVKTQLRTLFQKFGIEDLPQNQKRVKLVERVLGLGLISRRDL
jgi:pSer/pThr/pTyr-binding forkhead associated (FHA) protein